MDWNEGRRRNEKGYEAESIIEKTGEAKMKLEEHKGKGDNTGTSGRQMKMTGMREEETKEGRKQSIEQKRGEAEVKLQEHVGQRDNMRLDGKHKKNWNEGRRRDERR